MDSQTIICDAIRADGSRCGHVVRIHAAKYLYAYEPDERGQLRHVLRQTHFDIECPVCGLRKQIVQHHDG